MERWLQDKTRISVAIAPSLMWFEDGDEVSLLSICFCVCCLIILFDGF